MNDAQSHECLKKKLNVTLVKCLRIQLHIRQIELDIFQLQTGIQNLMTRLDLACMVQQQWILVTANTLYEPYKIHLPQNFPPAISLLAETE
jgi:hypothetical protein